MPKETVETNIAVATIGISCMSVEISREIIPDEDIQYLSFKFFQRSDTAGVAEIRINAVTRKEALELAEKMKQIAESFQ